MLERQTAKANNQEDSSPRLIMHNMLYGDGKTIPSKCFSCEACMCAWRSLAGCTSLSRWVFRLTECYTEKASPTRHRPERQHNASSNRRKQCSPNDERSVVCSTQWHTEGNVGRGEARATLDRHVAHDETALLSLYCSIARLYCSMHVYISTVDFAAVPKPSAIA